MANSSIKITFTEDLALDAQLGFDVEISGGMTPYSVTYIYNFVTLRSAAGQVTLGTPTATPGERNAINFEQAFNLDSGSFTVTRIVNEVTISAGNFGVYLTEFFVNGILAPYTNDPSLVFDIDNGSTNPFSVDSITYEESGTPCSTVLMNIETTELSVNITSPEAVTGNTDNPIQFEVLRSSTVLFEAEDADGNLISQSIVAPPILNASNFNLIINNSPNGASVIIDSVNSDGLELEYSLDGSTWQDENVFSGLIVDDYTLHVRDQYGCSFTKDFNIDEAGIYIPYFPALSKSNSIRYANRITFGDSENYKNDENTLSCEVDVDPSVGIVYTEIQQFQSADVITTQFKSNYALNVATIIKKDLTEVDVPVIKKTNNIGITDKRDARKYDLGNGKTGIYFISGNIYDYATNVTTGTYALNGLKPEWAKPGNYLNIGGIWYLIEDVVFDESRNSDVIVFTNTYTGPEVNVIVGSIYNISNYEVYEFTIDMVDYIDQYFRVRIVATDPHFSTITMLSELIWCKVKHERVLEIVYYNTTNTDILYSTGIKHKIRIPYLQRKGKLEESSEVHKTDRDAILLNADLFEADEFQFEPVTKEIWRKLTQALSHEIVSIDGVGYVKNGDFNTEGPLEQSNLYMLTATMIKTGNVYNSQTSGNIEFDGSQVEVPGLIETDNGYLKY